MSNMNYEMYINGALAWSSMMENPVIINGRIQCKLNVADNFSFSIYPDFPYYNSMTKLTTYIQVYRYMENQTILLFDGRVLNDTVALDGLKTVECEGSLAFFADSVVRPYYFTQGGPDVYLQYLVEQHNSQVTADKQITYFQCTVTDPNNLIVRSSGQYPSTLSEMINKGPKLLGGFFKMDYDMSTGTRYISYLADSTMKSAQTIEIGENLLTMLLDKRGMDIGTAIIPLGAVIENIPDEYTLQSSPYVETIEGGSLPNISYEPFEATPLADSIDPKRVTIESVNSGVDYIYDQDAVNKYGWIYKTVVWDDVTIPQNLLNKARVELGNMIQEITTLELTAVDLSKCGLSLDDFQIYQYVDVKTPTLTGSLMITEITHDLLTPQNSFLTVGSEYGDFTEVTIDNENNIGEIIINGSPGQDNSYINNQLSQLWTHISITFDSIMTEVGERYVSNDQFGSYVTENSTRFEQLANSFNFEFNQIREEYQNADGNLQGQFTEIQKYIRFVDGNIELGNSASLTTLRIQNDRISFIYQGAEVAYISQNKLMITDGQFLNSMQTGSFAFIPRASGAVSFGKIGGV